MAFAACGGGAATAPSKRTTAPATSATVRVANSRLATAWPPLLANGKPTAGWYALASAGNQIFPQQPSPGGGYGS
jgi:hypothetical protein